MKQPLEAKVLHAITSQKLLLPGEKCLVAVSGGLDSMVLLHLLNLLNKAGQWRLAVVHFNHRLRGNESEEDQEFVAAQAQALGLEYSWGHSDIMRWAQELGVSIEMAARKLRYEFILNSATSAAASKVALAHHRDDQHENFFLKLFRGNAGEGLAGMRWIRRAKAFSEVSLIRPFLDCSKSELKGWAQSHQIPFREDSTNNDSAYARNKVRNEVIPGLRSQFPNIENSIERWQTVLGDEKRFIAKLARDWLEREERDNFWALHVALQREIVHQQLISKNIPPEFRLIEALRAAPGKKVEARAGTVVRLSQTGMAELIPEEADFTYGSVTFSITTQLQTITADDETWQVAFSSPPASDFRPAPGVEFFDAAAVGREFKLRTWNPGDRFQPIGMRVAVKLQDLFTNKKIPRDARRKLLVAESYHGEIFWVQNLRIGENFKVRPNSEKLLKWEFRPLLSQQID